MASSSYPQLIHYTCNHSAVFHLSPPQIGDLLTCYVCRKAVTVNGKERKRRNVSPNTSRRRPYPYKEAHSES